MFATRHGLCDACTSISNQMEKLYESIEGVASSLLVGVCEHMASLGDMGLVAAINLLTAFAFLLASAILRIQPINDRDLACAIVKNLEFDVMCYNLHVMVLGA